MRGCVLSGHLAASLINSPTSLALVPTSSSSATILYPSGVSGKQLAPDGLMKMP